MKEIKTSLFTFLRNNFFIEEGTDLETVPSFLDSGVLDSSGIIELITFVEDSYNIIVKDSEITPQNFDSFQGLSTFIGKKTGNLK